MEHNIANTLLYLILHLLCKMRASRNTDVSPAVTQFEPHKVQYSLVENIVECSHSRLMQQCSAVEIRYLQRSHGDSTVLHWRPGQSVKDRQMRSEMDGEQRD